MLVQVPNSDVHQPDFPTSIELRYLQGPTFLYATSSHSQHHRNGVAVRSSLLYGKMMLQLCTVVLAAVAVLGQPQSAGTATPDWTTIRCQAAGASPSTLPTPTYGDNNPIFTSCSEQVINAPLSAVYDAILDLGSYPKWNSFVQRVVARDGASLSNVIVGLPMTFYSAGLAPFGIQTPSDERITVLDAPDKNSRLALNAWRFDPAAFVAPLIQAEHPNILTRLENGSTLYVSYETYYGLGSYAVQLAEKSSLGSQFAAQGRDLKKYVEGLQ